jgi:localization factor PodJL
MLPPSSQFGIPAAPATRPLNPGLPETAISSVPELNGMPTDKLSADITGSVPSSAGRRPPPPAAAPPAATNADNIPIAIGGPALRNAATAGDAAAAYEVAVRYAEGRGVPANVEESARWFERATRDGLAPAQFRLGSLYEKGQGVTKDLNKARQLYMAAAAKGNGKAMHNLAVLYAEGIDGKPDYAAAAQWFRKAATKGISDSQYNLGILCARGLGAEKNLGESYKWFALAAAQGDKEAGKKRDDVAARLDAKALTAAQHAVNTWSAEPQPDAAVNVPLPPAGWDQAAPGPAPERPKAQTSDTFEIGKR